MVNHLPRPWRAHACLAALMLLFGCTSGTRSNVIVEPPLPTPLNFVAVPALTTDSQNPFKPWLMTVNQQVQINALDSVSGQQVNDKLTWVIGGWTGGPLGSLDQTQKYTAPSSPSGVGISAGKTTGPVAYQGAQHITILAAPHITTFTAAPPAITPGQSSSLTPSFEDGQGQLDAGSQVIQASLVSGTPVGVSPTATTVYTLQVTNAAGAQVRQDLTVVVQ